MRTIVKGLSVETYDKMVRKGILPESNRFELIEGRIVEKMTKRRPHCGASERCWRRIHDILPGGWRVRGILIESGGRMFRPPCCWPAPGSL